MLQDERKLKIVEILTENTSVSVQELIETLKASPATIRRDLQELEDENIVKRSHGGAMLMEKSRYGTVEASFSSKEIEFLQEKKQIAKIASDFVQDGDIIILDSGTSIIQMTPFLLKKKDITIVTNSIAAANRLNSYSNINLILTGGINRVITKSLVGTVTINMLNNIYVDKVFLGTNGIHLEKGLTTPNLDEAEVKTAMIKSADKVFVLADSSKFNVITFAKFSELKNIDYIITDSSIDTTIKEKYESQGVEILINNKY